MRPRRRDVPARGPTRDPTTPEEWQEAVNAAYFCLLVDNARQYGLIEGGPVFDLARCEDLLARGKAMGIEPQEWNVTDGLR